MVIEIRSYNMSSDMPIKIPREFLLEKALKDAEDKIKELKFKLGVQSSYIMELEDKLKKLETKPNFTKEVSKEIQREAMYNELKKRIERLAKRESVLRSNIKEWAEKYTSLEKEYNTITGK